MMALDLASQGISIRDPQFLKIFGRNVLNDFEMVPFFTKIRDEIFSHEIDKEKLIMATVFWWKETEDQDFNTCKRVQGLFKEFFQFATSDKEPILIHLEDEILKVSPKDFELLKVSSDFFKNSQLNKKVDLSNVTKDMFEELLYMINEGKLRDDSLLLHVLHLANFLCMDRIEIFLTKRIFIEDGHNLLTVFQFNEQNTLNLKEKIREKLFKTAYLIARQKESLNPLNALRDDSYLRDFQEGKTCRLNSDTLPNFLFSFFSYLDEEKEKIHPILDFLKYLQNLFPNEIEIVKLRAFFYMQVGKDLDAEMILVQASQLHPSDAILYLLLGDVHKKQSKACEQDYYKATKVSSYDPRIEDAFEEAFLNINMSNSYRAFKERERRTGDESPRTKYKHTLNLLKSLEDSPSNMYIDKPKKTNLPSPAGI